MNSSTPQEFLENKSVIIVGGGITGLCSAYYLHKEGVSVTVMDGGDITDGCSFGNMGFLSPSHFIPLASPGIISEGLKYMLSSKSPFYMKPRLNMDFIKWGLQFYKNSTQRVVGQNIPHLSRLLQRSRRLMNEIKDEIGDVFDMEEIGCLMMCKSEHSFEHELKLADTAETLGLKVERLSGVQVQALEPEVEVNVTGAVLFRDDAHLDPGKFMMALKNFLEKKGVQFLLNSTVTGFKQWRETVTEVHTKDGSHSADYFVLSTGSWLPVIARKLGISLQLQPGKGYSYTYNHVHKNIRYPAILVDGRCAITPWKNKLRIGGTMEFSGINNTILPGRVQGIFNSVKSFYPGLEVSPPDIKKVWTGLRPVTPDGLPYIGKPARYNNIVIAGGHAMLGISEGAGTGKIVSEIIHGTSNDSDLYPFRIDRF